MGFRFRHHGRNVSRRRSNGNTGNDVMESRDRMLRRPPSTGDSTVPATEWRAPRSGGQWHGAVARTGSGHQWTESIGLVFQSIPDTKPVGTPSVSQGHHHVPSGAAHSVQSAPGKCGRVVTNCDRKTLNVRYWQMSTVSQASRV